MVRRQNVTTYNIIETREYPEGDRTVVAHICDDGMVRFSVANKPGATPYLTPCFTLGCEALETLVVATRRVATTE
jgi:hypothetical protein